MNPLTGLYAAASGLRNRLFDRGMLREHRLSRPVISVGNLSTGGTGKTPFVIALGGLLKERGISFDVLSRGYRRRTKGVLVVDPNGEAAQFGDEPLLISRKLGVSVIVGESRIKAGLYAEQQFPGSQLHILDDGFQHRSLGRDLDIVLLNGNEFQDRMLPSGRLREPVSALSRADAIALPEEVNTELPAALQVKRVWRTRREISIAHAPARAVVFCGIARPERFFSQVRVAGIMPVAEIAFGDHHSYRPAEIERLRKTRNELTADGFVTTEKDAINLGPLTGELQPLAVAELTVSIENETQVLDTILAKISK